MYAFNSADSSCRRGSFLKTFQFAFGVRRSKFRN